jgi:hypothetical protein
MTYSDRPPDRPGFYWTRHRDGSGREFVAEIEAVDVDGSGPDLFVSLDWDAYPLADYPHREWAGPVPRPLADEWASP